MSAEECKTMLTELGLEVKEVKKDDLQVMLINYISKPAIPVTTPVLTADPVLGQVPFFFASLSPEDKAKWLMEEECLHENRRLDKERHHEQRESAQAARDFELAEIREQLQAEATRLLAEREAEAARLCEEREAAAAEQGNLAHIRQVREAAS